MWPDSQPNNETPYRCVECDAVIGAANLGSQPTESFVGISGGPVHRVVTVGGVEVHRCLSPFLMLSDSVAAICAESAWARIATARDIVAEQAGCSSDQALRALKDRADVLGDPIGTLAKEVIDGDIASTAG
jgi:hypothetical protein